MKTQSKCLIVGAVLTTLWMFACPKYTVEGDNPTLATYRTRVPAWKTERRDGRNVRTRTTRLINNSFKHFSPEHFWGGEIIIWSLTLAWYLNRKESNNDSA